MEIQLETQIMTLLFLVAMMAMTAWGMLKAMLFAGQQQTIVCRVLPKTVLETTASYEKFE